MTIYNNVKMWVTLILSFTWHSLFSQDIKTKAQFDSLIQTLTYEIELKGEELSGKGAEWLIEEAKLANYFLIGERHGNAETPQLSVSIYNKLVKYGYNHAVLEIGEYAAYKTQDLLEKGGYQALESYLENPSFSQSIAFLDWKEEAELASSIANASSLGAKAIWGVDHEFIFGCEMYLDMLMEKAYAEEQKSIIKKLKDDLKKNKFLLGSEIKTNLENLKHFYEPSKDTFSIGLIDALITSNLIYGRFRGEITRVESNTIRENLMKTTFRDLLLNYENSTGKKTKVFFKMGGFHAAPNINLGKATFGTFIEEWAIGRDEKAFNLFIDVNGGKTLMSGQDNPQEGSGNIAATSQFGLIDSTEVDFEKRHIFSKLLEKNTKIVLIDLSPLRKNLYNLAPFINERALSLISGFDAYLAIPNVTPASPF